MNPLQELNRQLIAAQKRKQLRRKKMAAAVVCLLVTVGVAAHSVRHQVNLTPTIVEVSDGGDESAVAEATLQSAPATAPEPSTQFQQKLTFKPDMSFDEARAMFASHTSSYAQTEQPSGVRVAALPQITVDPKASQKPAVQSWTASLEQRRAIARNYLARNCPDILKLESMQSAQSKKETDDRFMAAKSASGVIGSLIGELRTHSIVVGQMCPTEFYAKLFPPKQ